MHIAAASLVHSVPIPDTSTVQLQPVTHTYIPLRLPLYARRSQLTHFLLRIRTCMCICSVAYGDCPQKLFDNWPSPVLPSEGLPSSSSAMQIYFVHQIRRLDPLQKSSMFLFEGHMKDIHRGEAPACLCYKHPDTADRQIL